MSCVDVNERKNGTAKSGKNSRCLNTRGDYDCECLPGYKGDGFTCRKNEQKGKVSITYICKEGFDGNGKNVKIFTSAPKTSVIAILPVQTLWVIIILSPYLTIIEFIHELCVISDLTYIITHKSLNIHLMSVKA